MIRSKQLRMCAGISLILTTFVFISFYACTSDSGGIPHLTVKWQLVENFEEDGSSRHLTVFEIINNSSFQLDDKNWGLYWSQSPRPVVSVNPESKVAVRHINGDFYEMKPTTGFSLGKNQSVKAEVVGDVWMIKNADAPVGMYLVYNTGEKEEIVVIEDLEIAPFVKEKQINRSKDDKEPIPTAQQLFAENDKIRLLGEKDIYPILPNPVSYNAKGGKLVLNNGVNVFVSGDLRNEEEFFKENLQEQGIEATAQNGLNIALVLNDRLTKTNAYTLNIEEGSVRIAGKDPAGVFYGIQSFLALLSKEDENSPMTLPICEVQDHPAYDYRGLHIDVARNFQTKESIMRMIDVMAMYKMNKMLLYLTEDEGWRIEIKPLPELTSIASKRGHTLDEKTHLQPSYGSGPFTDPANSYGSGYYSREEYIELLQYATKRHVEVIPMVNMPGHARAAIVAMERRYDRLMAEGKKDEALKYRLADPDDKSKYFSAQHYNDNVVCVCQDAPYVFYETVLDELIAIYKEAGAPLNMMHLGGDEVPGGAWSDSPMCKEFLKDYPDIKNTRNLGLHFFKKLADLIIEKGLLVGGWEEVVMEFDENDVWFPNKDLVNKNFYPYIWNNTWGNQDLGNKIANAGYPIVLCPVTNVYFDLAYDKDPREPGLYWGGFNNTKDAFSVLPQDMLASTLEDPMGNSFVPERDFKDMVQLTKAGSKNIVGLQGQLWSETVRGQQMMEYYILPKLFGLAQRSWEGMPDWGWVKSTDERKELRDKDWNVFANTIAQRELERLDKPKSGPMYYRIPAPGVERIGNQIHMNTSMPGMEIRYTTDGTEPTMDDPIYTGPLTVDTEKVLARCFAKTGRGGFATTFTNSLAD